MTSAEYREALAALGLSQVGAAKLFGVNPVTSRRWAGLGGREPEIPDAVAIALRLMIRHGVAPAEAAALRDGSEG